MKELVTTQQMEMVLRALAVAAPLAGAVIGLAAGAARKRLVTSAAAGLALGLAGPLLYGLWRVYLSAGRASGYAGVGFVAAMAAGCAIVGLVLGVLVQRTVNAASHRTTTVFEKVKSTQEEQLNA